MKKIIFTLLLIFSAFGSASAQEKTFTLDYTEDITSFFEYEAPYVNGTIETAINKAIEYYKNKNKNFIVAIYPYENSFSLYFYNDINDVSFSNRYDAENEQYLSSFYTISGETIDYCNFSNFSSPFSSWEEELQRCDENSSSFYTGFTFSPEFKINEYQGVIPYYSTFKISEVDEDQDYILNVHSEYGNFEPTTLNNLNYLMYYNYYSGDIEQEMLPTVKYKIGSKELEEKTKKIKRIYLRADISEIDYTKYKYEYSIDSGNTFQLYEDKETYVFNIEENTTVIFKISFNENPSLFKTYSFVVDGIGKDNSYYDVAEGKYNPNLDNNKDENFWDILEGGVESIMDFLGDTLNSYKSYVSDSFPILGQIGDIFNAFNIDRNKYETICISPNTEEGFQHMTDFEHDYCPTDFTIDFGFIFNDGFTHELTILDLSSFEKYRNTIFTMIKIFIGVLTFFKVIKILEVTFKR